MVEKSVESNFVIFLKSCFGVKKSKHFYATARVVRRHLSRKHFRNADATLLRFRGS